MEKCCSKELLRKEIKRVFALESFLKNNQSNSKIISDDIVKSDFYKNADVIMGYMALNDEVDITAVLLKALEDNKKVLLPKCNNDGNTMSACLVGDLKQDLSTGYAGILEPVDQRSVGISEIDVVFVPGRAFDLYCNRLGRGKGFYDRFLEKKPSVCKIGIAFDFQIVEQIKTNENDVFMDCVITEERVLIRNKKLK